jgi:hypothetical protein
VGASWEGFVIDQILGTLAQAGRQVEPHFFRTSDQYEIDLILDFGRRLWAIEVKLTASPSPADLARLNTAADLIKADRRILVSRTTEIISEGRHASCNLPWLLQLLESQG